MKAVRAQSTELLVGEQLLNNMSELPASSFTRAVYAAHPDLYARFVLACRAERDASPATGIVVRLDDASHSAERARRARVRTARQSFINNQETLHRRAA